VLGFNLELYIYVKGEMYLCQFSQNGLFGTKPPSH
jgi:hypothetical protein